MQRFRKLLLLLSSVGSVLFLYAVFGIALTAVAGWAERQQNSYPWRYQDYLRSMLPSLYENRGAHRILLVGPSEAREAFIYQRIEESFPHMEAFQGSQTAGTFAETLLFLDYIDRVYGPSARPNTLVVGITPRFVSNIISENKQRLFVSTVGRYSPYYRIESTPEGLRLVDKTYLQSWAGRLRFLTKAPERYATAVLAVLNRLMDDPVPYPDYEQEYFARVPPPRTLLESVRLLGPRAGLGRWSAVQISPYRYHQQLPRPLEVVERQVENRKGFWQRVYAWEPADDAALIHSQFDRLARIAHEWNMRVYIVNLPEHPFSRARYRTGRYEQYLKLVETSLCNTPFLNLRDMFSAEDFYDTGHLTMAAGVRMTDRVIAFMQTDSGKHQMDCSAGVSGRPASYSVREPG